MARKDLSKIDNHRTNGARRALTGRYDTSRRVPFDAELSKLAQNPQNPRYAHDPAVQQLADSFNAVGQLQTVTAVPREAFVEAYPDVEEAVSGDATWVIYVGNRRHAAAKLAGWTSLSVVLAESVGTAGEIEDAIIHENLHREGLPPLLLADMYRRKMEREGQSARQLAKEVGVSHVHVNDHLAILNGLGSQWQQLMQQDELDLNDAKRIARVDAEVQARLFDQREHLAKLAPGAREMAFRGELTGEQISRLAELPRKLQRENISALKNQTAATDNRHDAASTIHSPGENSVSTSGADDAADTKRPGTDKAPAKVVGKDENSATTAPTTTMPVAEDGARNSVSTGGPVAAEAATWRFPTAPQELAAEIRRRFSAEQIAALVAELE